MSVDSPMEPTPLGGEGIAEAFVERELAKTKTRLMWTRVLVPVGVIATGVYLGLITNGFRENLQPKSAAVITTSLVNQRMDDAEPQFASFVLEKVPETIRRAPDYALQRLPEVRASLEQRVEDELRSHAKSTSDQLSKELTDFLNLHKTEVEAMLTEPNKAGTADAMGAALEEQFRTYLAEQPVGGETIQSRLDKTLKAMDDIEVHTSRLALNQGLTPAEQKSRHAIALLMRKIDRTQLESPAPVIDSAAVKAAVDKVGEAIQR